MTTNGEATMFDQTAGPKFGRTIDPYGQGHLLTAKTRWLIAANVRAGLTSGDTGLAHGPETAPVHV